MPDLGGRRLAAPRPEVLFLFEAPLHVAHQLRQIAVKSASKAPHDTEGWLLPGTFNEGDVRAINIAFAC